MEEAREGGAHTYNRQPHLRGEADQEGAEAQRGRGVLCNQEVGGRRREVPALLEQADGTGDDEGDD